MKACISLAGLVAAGAMVLFQGCYHDATTSMDEGDRLYRAKCASCHQLVDPQALTPAQWQARLAHHGPRMTQEQRSTILGYLTRHASPPPGSDRTDLGHGMIDFTPQRGNQLTQEENATSQPTASGSALPEGRNR